MTDQAVTDPIGGLAALRRQVVDLLAQIDLGEMPKPTRVRSKTSKLPGAEWTPLGRPWRIFTVDNKDGSGAVYLDWYNDGPWGEPGDWESLRPADARRIAMALLAAADWAEEHRVIEPLPLVDEFGARRATL